MNPELKNMLTIVFDLLAVGQDVIGKNYFQLLSDAMTALAAVPAAIGDIGDLSAELAALASSPAAEADLVAFVESKFASVGSAKAQAILGAALKMVGDIVVVVQDGLAVKAAITG